MATIPATGGSFLPPPHLGHIQVEGDGLFLGDVSATINVNADQIVSATGSLTVQASGAGGTAGTAAVNVNGENGRAAWRERVVQYVSIRGVGGTLKKKKKES